MKSDNSIVHRNIIVLIMSVNSTCIYTYTHAHICRQRLYRRNPRRPSSTSALPLWPLNTSGKVRNLSAPCSPSPDIFSLPLYSLVNLCSYYLCYINYNYLWKTIYILYILIYIIYINTINIILLHYYITLYYYIILIHCNYIIY